MKANHNWLSVHSFIELTISNISKILNESKSQQETAFSMDCFHYFQYFKDTK